MDFKLTIACCIFSFITGMYIAHLIEYSHGCTIEVKRGQMITVTIGKTYE